MAYDSKGLFIGGEWRAASDGVFDDYNPSTGQVWASIPNATRADTAAAIEAAHKAFPAWAAMPFVARAALLNKAAALIEARQQDFVAAIGQEVGGTFGKCMYESTVTPGVYRTAAATGFGPIGEILPSAYDRMSMAVRKPIGVVSVISPWNFPLILSSRGIAFALAAGNTVVLKPSEESPVTGGLLFAEIFEEAGFPAGVVNVITCGRDNIAEVGDELVSNPLVKGISFTGSTPVGKSIAGKAGGLLKKCCVELGGKDALIVLDDANVDLAVNAAAFGAFFHAGQICMSVERIIVAPNLADEFTAKLVAKAATLKVGPTDDKSNIIGPLINARQADRVEAHIKDALAQGAKAAAGGERNGLFFPATVLTGVTPQMSVWRDETFGPVAPIIVADGEDAMVELANDTEYGLSAGIITDDRERGMRIAGRLDTGMAHINDSSVNDEFHAPFGGSKDSGTGRHGGRWAIETFTETRWITSANGHRQFPI